MKGAPLQCGSLTDFSEVQQIGEGTYGVVFKGRHVQTNKWVALKKIRLDRDNEGVPSTCIREISLLKDLDHENVVRLYDVIHHGMRLFMVFEFVDRDLKGVQDKLPQKRVPLEYVKFFISQLLQALTYCHTRRVIHRDLKPQNLLVSNSGIIKLADFGLARAISLPARPYTHEVVTLWYRAPEVLMSAKQYGTGIDVWSLACIHAEMANGRPMFPGDSEIDQLYRTFRILGTPTPETWPGVEEMPDWKAAFPKWEPNDNKLQVACAPLCQDGVDMIKEMLAYPPEDRLNCREALSHRYLRNVNLRLPPITDFFKNA